MLRIVAASFTLLAAALLSGGPHADVLADHRAEAGLEGELTVFAASSLTDAFDELGEAFETAHPDVEVLFSYASASTLANQIVEGAPADVYASADAANMDVLTAADAAGGDPVTFATNSLAILVEPDNPHGIGDLSDLSDPDLIVVSCPPEVPIGAYTQRALAAAGVEIDIDSYEENARAVAAKVILGEADAGIVFATDAIAAGDDAEAIAIRDELNVVAEYPIVTTAEARDHGLAEAFIAFVLDDEAQTILAEHGFGPPDPAAEAPPESTA